MKLNKLFTSIGINKASQAMKSAKSAAATVAKEAPKASAAEAMENQGRAMVKFSKPVSMEKPETLKATSNRHDWGEEDPFDPYWD